MVHRQQAVIGSLRIQRHREIGHAVVVHTGLGSLLDGGVTAVLLKGGHIAGYAHGVAPFVECAGSIALGHHHFIFTRKRHRAETEAARARHIAAQHRSLRRIGQAQHTERQSRSHAQCTAALQHGAARQAHVHHLRKCRIAALIADFVGVAVFNQMVFQWFAHGSALCLFR